MRMWPSLVVGMLASAVAFADAPVPKIVTREGRSALMVDGVVDDPGGQAERDGYHGESRVRDEPQG